MSSSGENLSDAADDPADRNGTVANLPMEASAPQPAPETGSSLDTIQKSNLKRPRTDDISENGASNSGAPGPSEDQISHWDGPVAKRARVTVIQSDEVVDQSPITVARSETSAHPQTLEANMLSTSSTLQESKLKRPRMDNPTLNAALAVDAPAQSEEASAPPPPQGTGFSSSTIQAFLRALFGLTENGASGPSEDPQMSRWHHGFAKRVPVTVLYSDEVDDHRLRDMDRSDPSVGDSVTPSTSTMQTVSFESFLEMQMQQTWYLQILWHGEPVALSDIIGNFKIKIVNANGLFPFAIPSSITLPIIIELATKYCSVIRISSPSNERISVISSLRPEIIHLLPGFTLLSIALTPENLEKMNDQQGKRTFLEHVSFVLRHSDELDSSNLGDVPVQPESSIEPAVQSNTPSVTQSHVDEQREVEVEEIDNGSIATSSTSNGSFTFIDAPVQTIPETVSQVSLSSSGQDNDAQLSDDARPSTSAIGTEQNGLISREATDTEVDLLCLECDNSWTLLCSHNKCIIKPSEIYYTVSKNIYCQACKDTKLAETRKRREKKPNFVEQRFDAVVFECTSCSRVAHRWCVSPLEEEKDFICKECRQEQNLREVEWPNVDWLQTDEFSRELEKSLSGFPVKLSVRTLNLSREMLSGADLCEKYEHMFTQHYGEFTFTARSFAVFQRVEGRDCFLVIMFTEEYQNHNGRNWSVINYVDTIQYNKKSGTGIPLTTETRNFNGAVANHVLEWYTRKMKERGYTDVNVWANAPKKREDYCFFKHPPHQVYREQVELQSFYSSLFKRLIEREIIKKFATDEEEDIKIETAQDLLKLPVFKGSFYSFLFDKASGRDEKAFLKYVNFHKKDNEKANFRLTISRTLVLPQITGTDEWMVTKIGNNQKAFRDKMANEAWECSDKRRLPFSSSAMILAISREQKEYFQKGGAGRSKSCGEEGELSCSGTSTRYN